MTEITASQLTRLRKRPQRTILNLGIFEPQTVVASQINEGGISKGERVITVTVNSGDVADIENGMTAYISTVEGGKELGRVRAISGSAGTITLAENDFDWENGWFITVTTFREPWAVFPRITLDASNNASFFKDFDQVYTDQNERWQPVVVMGPNHAGFIETGSLGVYYSSSGSFVPDASISGYSWEFDGGSPSSSTLADPGFVQYATPGFYTTKLTITSTQLKTLTGTRHILVYDKPDAGPNRPPVRWGIRSIEGSRETSGYAIDFWIREEADIQKVVDGALIVLFSEDFEGGVKTKVGGNAENREEIFFVGYVQEGTISKNFVESRIQFRAISITSRMDILSTYAATLESKQSPTTWNEAKNMTVDKAIISFLRFQSTIFNVTDFSQTGDAKPVQFADFSRGNLFQAANEFLFGTIFASIVSDRQGKIWAEVDTNISETGTRGGLTSFQLTNQDWRSELNIKEQSTRPIAFVEFGGIAYSGPSTGTFKALLSVAPGDPVGYFGEGERGSGLVIAGQNQLNILTALVFNDVNARYPRVDVPMAGDYRFIDIAPQERFNISLVASDTFRRIVWDGKNFIPQEISYQYNAALNSLIMDVTVKEETEGAGLYALGRTITIPIDPPWQIITLPPWEFPVIPPISLPPIGVPLPPVLPPPADGATVYAIYGGTSGGGDDTVNGDNPLGSVMLRTRNFFDAFPTWERVNTLNLPGVPITFRLDPDDPQNTAWACSGQEIYKTTNLDDTTPAWETILSSGTLATLFGGGPVSAKIWDIKPHPDITGLWWGAGRMNDNTRPAVIISEDDGVNWSASVVTGNNHAANDQNPAILAVGRSADTRFGTTLYLMTREFFYQSINGGTTWTLKYTSSEGQAGIRDLEVFDNDPSMQSVIGTDGTVETNQNPTVLFSIEGMGAGTRLAVPPFFDVNGVLRIYGGTIDRNSQDAYKSIIVNKADGQLYGLFVTKFAPGDNQSKNTDTIFAFSPGPGQPWTVRRYFDDLLQGLKHNPTDALKFYAFGDVDEQRIMGTEDGGNNWSLKTGNAQTVLGLVDMDNIGEKVGLYPITVI